MKLLFSFLIILTGYCSTWAQDGKTPVTLPAEHPVGENKKVLLSENEISPEIAVEHTAHTPDLPKTFLPPDRQKKLFFVFDFAETDAEIELKESIDNTKPDKPFIFSKSGKPDEPPKIVEEKFHWKPALLESVYFLGIQHAFRMTQAKTRRELGGPFFRDWGRSVRSLHGWGDGNKVFTNYVAHPLQGGVTGRIFINNSDRAKKQEFGKSLKYWESRLKAMAWSAVWSTQFELGPVSEATIGNVGINAHTGYNKMAWVDLVITPVVGTGVVIAEDALDKYVLKNWLEKKNKDRNLIKAYRVIFTPTAAFTNILRGKMPWHRDDRLIGISRQRFSR